MATQTTIRCPHCMENFNVLCLDSINNSQDKPMSTNQDNNEGLNYPDTFSTNYEPLNNIIEEFRKKWEIKGNNIWWEEPFKRCFEAGIKQGKQENKSKDAFDKWDNGEEFIKSVKRKDTSQDLSAPDKKSELKESKNE